MGIEQKGDYSTNESDVRLSEVIQLDNEEKISSYEAKIEFLLSEKSEIYKKLQRTEDQRDQYEKENQELKSINSSIESR